MRPVFFIPLFLALLFLSGCSQEGIDRLKAMSEQADQALSIAKQASKSATESLAAVKAVAEATQNVDAIKAVAKAESVVAESSDALAKALVAKKAVDSALALAQEGDPWWMVTLKVVGSIGAAAAGLGVPWAVKAAPMVGVAVRTIQGLQSARQSMGDAVWNAHVAPALEAAQNAKDKQIVKSMTG